MIKLKLDDQYWNEKYDTLETGWDIGYPSPAFISYFEKIEDRNVAILIPGCGNSYEGEALFKMGFSNITLLDFATISKENFLKRVPEFPAEKFIVGDFFQLENQYDFILEQTFFCAINPSWRKKYVEKMKTLLKPNGKLVGILFDAPLNTEHPPFGGCKEDYIELFSQVFDSVKMMPNELSIPPRAGKEVWIEIF